MSESPVAYAWLEAAEMLDEMIKGFPVTRGAQMRVLYELHRRYLVRVAKAVHIGPFDETTTPATESG